MLTLLLAASTLLFAGLQDFEFESGETLRECKIGYRLFGKLNDDKSNVVLFPSWFGGISGDLDAFVGPGKVVDDTKYYVVAVDAITNGVSCSPSNQPERRNNQFPKVTVRDMVNSQYRLLTEVLEIEKGHAVVGISMGGMQAFQWLVSYPNFFKKGVSIVGTPRMNEKDMQMWATMIKMPGGKKDPQDPNAEPDAAPAEDNAKKGRLDQILGMAKVGLANYGKFKAPMDNWRQFDAMRGHNIGAKYGGSLDRAARSLKADMLIYIATEDKLVSGATPKEFAKDIGATLIEVEGKEGHQIFRKQELFAAGIEKFLAEKGGERAAKLAAEKAEAARSENGSSGKKVTRTEPKSVDGQKSEVPSTAAKPAEENKTEEKKKLKYF
jgi:homoserine O-acetyltransferase/O-succinyltransferase